MDVNYGENYAPFDYFFGTHAKDEEDFDRLTARRQAAKKKQKE